ncbi:MAG: hypothetical protein GY928_04075 [Colwellia sp.]|nr:hypothetical protein [Colwellia sp.]
MENTKEQFIASLEKKVVDYSSIFAKLYRTVIETNALTGLVRENLTEAELEDKLEIYRKFTMDEIEEMVGAYKEQDRYELIKELLDVLVVGGYWYHLKNDRLYSSSRSAVDIESGIDIVAKAKSVEVALHYTQSLLQKMGCDLDKAVDEVLNENLSKLSTLDDIEKAFEQEYSAHKVSTEELLSWACSKLEGERYSGVTAEKVVDSEGDTRYVMWCEKEYGVSKKKYLKGVSYRKCNLTDIWS